jgi:hypothetical protein
VWQHLIKQHGNDPSQFWTRQTRSAEAVELTPMTPNQFLEYMKRDLARWTDLARERKINLDA